MSENEATLTEAEVSTVETTMDQKSRADGATVILEETITTEQKEETVECIDKVNQSLAEYKPQIDDQPNPFENDTPTEIDDRPRRLHRRRRRPPRRRNSLLNNKRESAK